MAETRWSEEEFQKPNLTSDDLHRLACAIIPTNTWDNIIPYVKRELVEELNKYGDFNNLIEDKKKSDIKNIFLEKTSKIDDDEIKDEIDFLLGEYIKLINLVNTAHQYLSLKGLLDTYCPEYNPWILKEQFLDEYLYEDIAEIYQREIDKVRLQKKIDEVNIQKKNKQKSIKKMITKQREAENNGFTINPMHKLEGPMHTLKGGRRSTRKRKKTIRKKRKNKKRTRRFR